jgi:peptidyl-prolyl cis-trans isomerase C
VWRGVLAEAWGAEGAGMTDQRTSMNTGLTAGSTRGRLSGLWRRARGWALATGAALALTACGLDASQDTADSEGITNPVVAATVNGRPIYIDDVRMRAMESCGLAQGQDVESDPGIFNCALRLLIEERLFSAEAERRGLDRDPEVRRQLELARERVLANAIYRDLYEVASEPERVESVFRNNQRDLGGRPQVGLSQIVVDSRGTALAALRRLQSGESFEALAMELSLDRANASSGGYLGEQLIEELPPAFRDLATTLEVGAVGGPIESPAGWHLIRVESRGRSDGQSLDASRPRIINVLLQQEVDDLYNRLAGDAVIETVTEQVAPPLPAQEAPEEPASGEGNEGGAGVGPGALASGAGAAPAPSATPPASNAAPPAPSGAPVPSIAPRPSAPSPSPSPSQGPSAPAPDEPIAAGPSQ